MPTSPVDHKIALLGPIPYDHITLWNNQLLDRYGGLTYPAIALSNLLGKKARITPVTNVRKKDQQTIKAILRGHPGIELLRINADADMGDIIKLKFITKYKCLEKQYGFMNPILPEDVKYLLDSDFFMLLPVTESEISLETLQFIKAYSKGIITFDAHGVTRAMTSLGDRVTRFWVDRDLWLPYIDILVMTKEQIKYSWFEKEYTLEQLEEIEDLTAPQVEEFAKHCFAHHVKALFITENNLASTVYFPNNNAVTHKYIEPIKLEATIADTSGRSEAYAAGLVFGLIKHNNDYLKAAYYGNVLCAQRTRTLSYDAFDSLEDTLKMVKDNYNV